MPNFITKQTPFKGCSTHGSTTIDSRHELSEISPDCCPCQTKNIKLQKVLSSQGDAKYESFARRYETVSETTSETRIVSFADQQTRNCVVKF